MDHEPTGGRPARHRPLAGPLRVGLQRLAWLVCLVPAACALGGLLPAAPADAAPAPFADRAPAPLAAPVADRGWGAPTRWRLPLAGPPQVAAPFAAPAGPYAPGHRGVDLRAAPTARVLAAGAGVVAFAGRVAGRGVVSVDHPDGLRTTYQPVEPAVRPGDRVAAGAVLGLLAGVGGHCPPAACLHWGVRRGPVYLDPMSLLGAVRVRLLPVWSAAMLDP